MPGLTPEIASLLNSSNRLLGIPTIPSELITVPPPPVFKAPSVKAPTVKPLNVKGAPVVPGTRKLTRGTRSNPAVVVDHQEKVSPLSAPIVKLAAQYLGRPYVWGGASPSTGFDCSGFVQWLYGQKGIRLPRTTFEQVHAGRAVDYRNVANLRPGDIVFFNTENDPRGPSHEGLYIGHGQFIQSPHTGDVIKFSSLNDSYYHSRLVAVRRVL